MAMIESGNGTNSLPGAYNYWGYNAYNNASSGKSFSSFREAVEEVCQWHLNRIDPESSAFKSCTSTAQEFATVNNNFNGEPKNNLYVIFCTYAQLGEVHYCADGGQGLSNYERLKKFDNDSRGYDGTGKPGSWRGGRYYTYEMYENGSISTGMYDQVCGSIHPNASDPTTLKEKADYGQYSVDVRVKKAEGIFGQGCIGGSSTSTVESVKVANAKAQTAINYALSKVGCGYSQASDLRLGPNYYDCSGLMYMAYKQAGITIPTSTANYGSYGRLPSNDSAMPGDILWRRASGDEDGHVAMYLGDGLIVEAANSKAGVRTKQYNDLASCMSVRGFTNIYRFWDK